MNLSKLFKNFVKLLSEDLSVSADFEKFQEAEPVGQDDKFSEISQENQFDLLLENSIKTLLNEQLHKAGSDFFFIQIGANDGISFDWLYNFVTTNNVRGIVVEPLKDIFQELCKNYEDYPQVIPVNKAIHRTEKSIEIYRVDPEKAPHLPDWSKGIASVDFQHHKKSNTPTEYIISERVPCLTINELIKKNNVTRIDLLQVDIEGYDHEVIKMFDFSQLKPSIIRFEHRFSDNVMSREQFLECAEILINAGYYLIMNKTDTIAYL